MFVENDTTAGEVVQHQTEFLGRTTVINLKDIFLKYFKEFYMRNPKR
jgi:hypothetical protein